MHRIFVLLLFGLLQNSANTNALPASQEIDKNFLCRLTPSVDINLTPPFVLNLIANDTLNSMLSASDIIDVLSLDRLNLQDVKDVLTRRNIDPAIIFSPDYITVLKTGLQMTTSTFVDRIRTELGVFDDRKATDLFLAPLGISSATYFEDYQYNELTMLTAGNFNEATLREATAAIKRSLDDLYIAVRNTFFQHIKTTPAVDNWEIVSDSLFPQGILSDFSKGVRITVQNIEKVTTLLDLFKSIEMEMNKNALLGALTDRNKITINKDTAIAWKNYSDIAKIQVTSVVPDLFSLITDSGLTFTPADNIFELTAHTTVHLKYAIRPGKTGESLENCTFFTLQPDGVLVSEIIPNSWNASDDLLVTDAEIAASPSVYGSPLVCGDRLYGLQRSPLPAVPETLDFKVTLDTLYDAPEIPMVSGQPRPLLSALLTLIYAFVFYLCIKKN